MTAQAMEPFNVRTVGNHVEVAGLSQAEVERALELRSEVLQRQGAARTALEAQVDRAFIEGGLKLVEDAAQRQVMRNFDLRKRLLASEGFETYATLSERRGSTESAARIWVTRQRDKHELFTVELQGRTLIPSVQLTTEGRLDAEIAEINRILLKAGLGPWSMWTWLTSPTGRLSGEIPAQVAKTNMPRVRRAAKEYAEELRTAAGEVA